MEPPKKCPKRVPARPRNAQSRATVVVDSGDDALTLRRTARAHAWYSYTCMHAIKFESRYVERSHLHDIAHGLRRALVNSY